MAVNAWRFESWFLTSYQPMWWCVGITEHFKNSTVNAEWFVLYMETNMKEPPTIQRAQSIVVGAYSTFSRHWDSFCCDAAWRLCFFLFQFFFCQNTKDSGVINKGKNYSDECGENNDCMTLLSLQVAMLMIMKPLPKLFTDVIKPWVFHCLWRYLVVGAWEFCIWHVQCTQRTASRGIFNCSAFSSHVRHA